MAANNTEADLTGDTGYDLAPGRSDRHKERSSVKTSRGIGIEGLSQ